MNTRKILSIGILAVLIVGLFLAAFPARTVSAQTPTPEPKGQQMDGKRVDARLERIFKAQQRALERQAVHFERVAKAVDRVQALITRAKANGRDTSLIEAALEKFKAKVAEAKKAHDAAAATLKTHAGFSNDGKVVDRTQARETIKTAHEQLRSVRQIFAGMWKALHEAIKAWRQANPPKITPTP